MRDFDRRPGDAAIRHSGHCGRRMGWRGGSAREGASILLPVLTAAAFFFTAATSFAQMLATNKLTYLPGDTVTITGEGWQPGEAVSMTIGKSSGTNNPVEVKATAGDDGKFADRSFIVQEADRGSMMTLTARGESGAVAFLAFRGAAAPGALRCAALTATGSSNYLIAPAQSVICTIEGAADLSPAQQAGTAPVEVLVKGETTGNLPAKILSVSGSSITFEYTAPAAACGRGVVSYGPVTACDPIFGNCTVYPASGNDANSHLISGSHDAAGFIYRAQGTDLACAKPQLVVEKLPQNLAFTQGSQLYYKIYVSNPAPLGSGSAEGVVLTEELPGSGELVWESASASQGSCDSPIKDNKLLCTLGSIPPQGSVTVIVSSMQRPPATACQSQPDHQIMVTAAGGLKAASSGSITCTPPPQLAVTNTPNFGTFTAGSTIGYTIVVSNPAKAGSNPASNVLLTETLPQNGGVTWASATTTAGGCILTHNYLSCQLGDIPAGGKITVVVTSNMVPAAGCLEQPNAHAVAVADGALTAEASCSVSCTAQPQGGTTLASTPGLVLVKTPSTTTPAPGEVVTYTYTVANTGSTTLTNVRITDDNGTPNNLADDFTVGYVATLGSGASAVFTAKTVPSDTSIVARLGAAGPSSFSVLSLGSDASHDDAGIYCALATVIGNVGIVSNGYFHNASPCTENGDYYHGPAVDYLALGGHLNGSDITSDLTAVRNEAFNASAYFARLPVTPSVQRQFPSDGKITTDRIVTGTPGINVVQLSVLNVKANLTLTGPPGTQFVLNIAGSVNLSTGNIRGAGSVGPYDVIYNITSPKASVGTGKVVSATGILLAPYNSIYALYGSRWDGEVIGGYNQGPIKLNYGVTVGSPNPPLPIVTATTTATALSGGAPVSTTATTTVTITSSTPGIVVVTPPGGTDDIVLPPPQ